MADKRPWGLEILDHKRWRIGRITGYTHPYDGELPIVTNHIEIRHPSDVGLTIDDAESVVDLLNRRHTLTGGNNA